MDLGFRSSLKIAEKVLRKSLYQEAWENDSGDPYHSRKSCICLMRLPIFFPRLTTCAKYIESKTNRGPSREGPLSRASLRPQLFCEFYLQPVYRAASTRFSADLIFRSTFPRPLFRTPLLLLAYASQNLPMLRLRARLTPNHVPH